MRRPRALRAWGGCHGFEVSEHSHHTREDAKKEKEENKATMFRQLGLGQWRSLISKKDPA